MKPFLPVLVFQKIGTPPSHSRLKSQWTSTRKLTHTLAFLRKCNYTFITPKDLQKPLPANPILLAFMGGYQSFYTEVFPLLQKYKAPATVFIATDTLGTYNSWQAPYREPWQNILTAKQLQEMYESNLVQVGTLGLSGDNLLAYQDPALAREEIRESIHRLKMLYKVETCAVGFWPDLSDKANQTARITEGVNLPVITSKKGLNARTETRLLHMLRLNFITTFLLWKNSRTSPER